MRRNAKSITASADIVKHIDGLTHANFQLLCKLLAWLDANEKAQKKFRFATLNMLARIEAAISLLVVGQEAQTQSKPPFYYADELEKSIKAAQDFVDKQSEERTMKMIRYIYAEDRATEPHHDRRRKWSGWEI